MDIDIHSIARLSEHASWHVPPSSYSCFSSTLIKRSVLHKIGLEVMQLFNLQAANSIGDRIRRNAVMRNIPQRSRSIGPTTQGTRYTIQTNVWDPSVPSHQQQLIKILRILKTLPDETISNRRLNTWSHISISVLHVCQFERRKDTFNVKSIVFSMYWTHFCDVWTLK